MNYPIRTDGVHQAVLEEPLSLPSGTVGLLSTALSVST